VYGTFIKLFNLLLRYLAILLDGACLLFTTGIIVSLCLCIFINALSLGAVGFWFTRYLLVLLFHSVTLLNDLLMTTVLQLSVFAAKLFCCKVFFVWFRLC